MTGRYPMRHGLQTLVIFPSHTYGLPTDERTLPQALKEAGYKTLMVGKWHLAHADKKFWPQNRGFDHFYGNVVGEVIEGESAWMLLAVLFFVSRIELVN